MALTKSNILHFINVIEGRFTLVQDEVLDASAFIEPIQEPVSGFSFLHHANSMKFRRLSKRHYEVGTPAPIVIVFRRVWVVKGMRCVNQIDLFLHAIRK